VTTAARLLTSALAAAALAGCGGGGGIEPGMPAKTDVDQAQKDQMKAMSKTMLAGPKGFANKPAAPAK